MSDSKISLDPKMASVLSHFTLVGWLVAYLARKEGQENLPFYLKQTLGIHFMSLLLYFIPTFIFFGGTLRLLGSMGVFACWVISLLGAISDEKRRIPLIGNFFQEQFKNL